MNVSCSNCPARYAVPDTKVRGKKVRMVCRHCGATISIDGTSVGESVRPKSAAPAPSRAPADAAPERRVPSRPVTQQSKPAPAPLPKPAPATPDEGWPDVTPAPVVVKPELISKLPPVQPKPSAAPKVGAADKKPGERQPGAGRQQSAPAPAPKATPATTKAAAPAPAQFKRPSAPAPGAKPEGLKLAEKRAEAPKPFTGKPAVVVSSKSASSAGTQPVAQASRSLKKTIVGGLEGPAMKAQTQAATGRLARTPEPRPAAPEPSEESLGTPEWTVAINDRDHTEMSTRQLVELYAIGAISAETFVWKPGMETWKTPFTIPSIATALDQRGFKLPVEPTGPFGHPRELRGFEAEDPEAANEEATVIQQVSLGSQLGAAAWQDAGTPEPRAEVAAADIPAANRSPFADRESLDEVTVAADSRKLIASLDEPVSGRALRTYGEDPRSHDVVTVARVNSARAPRPADSRAPSGEPPTLAPMPGALSSPTIYDEPTVLRAPDAPLPLDFDESPIGADRAAAERAPFDEPTIRRQAEAAELARRQTERADREGVEAAGEAPAPDFVRPRRKRRVLLWLLVGLLLIAGAAAAAVVLRPDLIAAWLPGLASLLPVRPPEQTSVQPTTSAPAPATATPSAAPSTSARPETEAAITPEAGATAEADAGAGNVAAATAAGSGTGEFSKKAGWAALGVAATKLGRCAEPEAQPLSGEVMVTFIPSGRVSYVDVRGELKDTPAGACVAQIFRHVTVPPFSGEPVHLARSLTVP
jgi:predicted Zn finger-like uncharacterized protein